jgi:predicted nuclease of restriction endonuclease-like RecB superfamily
VLTRELLIFRRVKGNLRPTFIDVRDEPHLALAAALIEIFEHGIGETRGTLEEALGVLVGEARKQKLARGLVKLLQDRCGFEEAGDAAATLRRQAFVASATTLRALPDDATLDLYLERLGAALPLPLDDCRTQLYADLAEHRRLLTRVLPTPQALLERYNLALAQGLALYAQGLRVRTPTQSQLELRKLLRWLKWSRLVAEVHREGDEWVLQVEGPGAMFDMQKKYGLQLANFLAAVPLLSKYTLEAEVDVPRGAKGTMVLDHKDPLRALDQSALGHIPPEIEAGMAALADERWTCEALPELRHTGATGMCVPDFGLRDRESGASVVVELFHRWHRHALLRRLDELRTRPDPALVLGVDLSLVKPGKDGKDDELAARVHDHPQVFTFNKFPSRRRLQPILDRVAAEALALRAAELAAKPLAKPRAEPAAGLAAKPLAKPRAEPAAEVAARQTPRQTSRQAARQTRRRASRRAARRTGADRSRRSRRIGTTPPRHLTFCHPLP